MKLFLSLFVSTLTSLSMVQAQTPAPVVQPPTGVASMRVQPTDNTVKSATTAPSNVQRAKSAGGSGGSEDPSSATLNNNYLLGPGDQLSLQVEGLEDQFTDEVFHIDLQGDVNLPMIGRFHVAGLTLNGFEAEVNSRLKKFVKDPDVVATISEYHSQPVSVLGAVNAPGVHQLQGHKTLYEVLSMAGGLRQDAGNSIRITRNLKWGPIPLPTAAEDSTKQYSTASIRVKSTLNASDPAQNIVVMPGDVITVPQGEVVYAVGSVNKPGGFLLGENESISTLQVISLAEGLDRTAAADRARVLRAVPGSSTRLEIPVNLKALMAGKSEDVPLQSNDILFIPTSASKTITKRTLDAMVQISTGIIVYGRY